MASKKSVVLRGGIKTPFPSCLFDKKSPLMFALLDVGNKGFLLTLLQLKHVKAWLISYLRRPAKLKLPIFKIDVF